jgi:hypothetical protein
MSCFYVSVGVYGYDNDGKDWVQASDRLGLFSVSDFSHGYGVLLSWWYGSDTLLMY